MHTRPPTTVGLELIRPRMSYTHRGFPVRALSANSRPSAAPTYTVFTIATGEDSTGTLTCRRQTGVPSSWRSAVIVPPCELTITSSPASAGLDAVGPAAERVQMRAPVV